MISLFKRCQITIASGFDSLMNRVENHEALISEAIREAQAATAQARVRLGHMQRDQQRLLERIRKLRSDCGSWERRAAEQAEEDRERALECLRRRNRARAELEHLEREAERSAQAQKTLSSDIRQLSERLDELKRRRNAMSAREFRAQAGACVQEAETGLLSDLDGIFDRWELRLAEAHPQSEPLEDDFDDAFLEQEELADLERELEALRDQKDA